VSGEASIVGAGIFGASLAYQLARDGWNVTLYERHEPGHSLAASGGESRLIRYSHSAESWYSSSAWRARDLWRELEAETGRELLVASGVAWFAHSEDGWESQSERTLRAEGIPVERLEPAVGRDLYPSFEPGDLLFILWEPEAGILRAQEATRATVEAAQRAGVRVTQRQAEPGTLDSDIVVWACGAWLATLFRGLVPLRVTRQDQFFFEGDEAWAAGRVPGWVDYDRSIYGLGDLGHGLKVAPDVEGPPFDPESEDRSTDPLNAERARAYAAERLPALAEAPIVSSQPCPYALTPDTNFIVAPHPTLPRNWLVGGGSGHGFKHGPALAEYAARVVMGEEAPDERFGLGPRERRPSLRTAGAT
jgi:sarcosine oxidase